MGNNDISKSFVKEIFIAVVAALATVLVTKACDRIAPEENKVVISDTLRVIEAQSPRFSDDSLLYVAISELNRTIRETLPKNNNIKIVWPESPAPSNTGSQRPSLEIVPSSINTKDINLAATYNSGHVIEDPSFVNRIVDKKGFYKKGYSISDGSAFYVLKKIPRAEDDPMTFEIRILQPCDLISHIYLNICSINEKGELYQFFGQTYDVRDGLNRIRIANNLREGKNRIEIGVFLKSDEGKDFPTYYRKLFTLVK